MTEKTKKHYLELEVTPQSIGEALADLTPDQVVEILQIADERFQAWEFVLAIHAWADDRHREWELERLEEDAKVEKRCVRSETYPDLWGHASPHIGCILR